MVVDNVGAHKPERIRALVEGAGCRLVFLPAYSPDLSPVEEAFSKLKALLHIQKFVEWDDNGGFGNFSLPSNFKPVSDNDGGGARMFIQTGSRMNDLPDDEDPF